MGFVSLNGCFGWCFRSWGCHFKMKCVSQYYLYPTVSVGLTPNRNHSRSFKEFVVRKSTWWICQWKKFQNRLSKRVVNCYKFCVKVISIHCSLAFSVFQWVTKLKRLFVQGYFIINVKVSSKCVSIASLRESSIADSDEIAVAFKRDQWKSVWYSDFINF